MKIKKYEFMVNFYMYSYSKIQSTSKIQLNIKIQTNSTYYNNIWCKIFVFVKVEFYF